MLFRKRTIWVPTRWGAVCLLIFVFGLGSLWWFRGEAYLSLTERVPADVLIVEGWISAKGIRAAATEFQLGGYTFVVATGGLTGEKWVERRWSYAEETEEQLLRIGLPRQRVIRASTGTTDDQRTYQMAITARAALLARGHHPSAINVFTRGAHGRRSRLIYAKVFGPDTQVGVISWIPPGFETESWWHSSDRAEDMIKESVGYLFELLFNSGRWARPPETASGTQEPSP